MHKLSIKSRKRWPETAVPTPRLGVPPPKPKAAPAPAPESSTGDSAAEIAEKPQGEPGAAE
jgi:hypothetical protein